MTLHRGTPGMDIGVDAIRRRHQGCPPDVCEQAYLLTVLAAARALHHPMEEQDFVQIPPVMVTVCAECMIGTDDFHTPWPCATAVLLNTLGGNDDG